jgi:ankyrin repeat protein
MSQRKRRPFASGDVEEAKKFFLDNATFNVNEAVGLHLACDNGHHEIISLLLAHPDINVNLKNKDGATPFLLGCSWGKSRSCEDSLDGFSSRH